MERSAHYLPNFGQLEDTNTIDNLETLLMTLSLSYLIIVLAMRGFTYLAIPIWVLIIGIISSFAA